MRVERGGGVGTPFQGVSIKNVSPLMEPFLIGFHWFHFSLESHLSEIGSELPTRKLGEQEKWRGVCCG